jgi:hypothetical protein
MGGLVGRSRDRGVVCGDTVIAKFLCALGLCLVLTAPARAQSDDQAYCAKLIELHYRYLPQTERLFPDVASSVAIDQCKKGNAAEGIPVLEKKLLDARFTLPKRN